ncbi:MAG: hypothetical protein R3C59_10320 [Planctomycetaceae bacterium]
MFSRIRVWFRQNAYGSFFSRVLWALGAAAVSVGLSFLPYDTALQAIWVVISSLFLAAFALRQRLNESDDVRYRRLFKSRFAWFQVNDPEALVTIFSENIRPPVLDWFETEYGIPVREAKTFDALDSLARSGDRPGQLIFRTGVELGKWIQEMQDEPEKIACMESRLQQFVRDNEGLLGQQIAPGTFLRIVRRGERRPTGVHLFHPDSRLLLTLEFYDENEKRHAPALSAKAQLFANSTEDEWKGFVKQVHREFPSFQPAKGGSGPQKQTIPFFIGSVDDAPALPEDELKARLLRIAALLPKPQSKNMEEEKEVVDVEERSKG